MAEVRNKKSILPWFIGIIVVAVVAWIVFEAVDRDNDQDTYTRTESPATGYAGDKFQAAVYDFEEYLIEESAFEEDAYIEESFEKLSDALEALVEVDLYESDMLKEKHDQFEKHVDEINGDMNDINKANHVKAAAVSAVEIIESVQQTHFTDFDIASVKMSAESIDGNIEQIDRFLVETKDLLKAMASRSGSIDVATDPDRIGTEY